MPPLADRLKTQSLPGFEAVENKPNAAPPMIAGAAVSGNRYIRCPLPPFSTTIDTLRQYNEGGAVPTRRVIPLPISTLVGGGTVINNTSVTNSSGSGGGGGSSSTTATLKSVTVFLNVTPLAGAGVFQATVQMAKSFQLLQIASSQPLEVRLYGNAFAQVSDVARLTDNAPPYEINGIITDVVLDKLPYQWNWQNRIGANADSPQGPTIYVNVVNPSTTATSSASIAITYLPLES